MEFENEDDFLTGCSYCKYKCGSRLSMFYEIRKRLTVETGVDVMGGGHSPLPHGKFPYMTFLKNANEEILEQYQTIFSNLQKSIRYLKGNADIQTTRRFRNIYCRADFQFNKVTLCFKNFSESLVAAVDFAANLI